MGNSGQNGKIIEQVIDEISNLEIQPTIVIKSTVIPNILENISKKITNVVYNPEFLREKHAHEDFVNSSFIILGGENHNLEKVKIFYEENTICKTNNFIFTDLFRASLAKYTINTFLASKVLFFNTINELFIKENYSNKEWKDFIEIIANDERVGSSHMDVPGHDGRKGFGGACFPKDIDALIKFGNLKNVDLSLLKTIQSLNNEIRSQYKVETEREIEQDIEFN